MSFLLSDCRELTFNELICVNGGCSGGIFASIADKIDAGIKALGNKLKGSSNGGSSSAGSPGAGTVSSTSSTCLGVSATSSGCSREEKSGLQNVMESIESNKDHRYVLTGNPKTEYRCDQWVEEVLQDAGYDSEKYLKGSSVETVADHITKLEEGSYSKTIPSESGAYVVFMADGVFKSGKVATEHCGILVVNESGNMTLWDNSSGNTVEVISNGVSETYTGGVGYTDVVALSKTKLSDFVYDTYYFQSIE